MSTEHILDGLHDEDPGEHSERTGLRMRKELPGTTAMVLRSLSSLNLLEYNRWRGQIALNEGVDTEPWST